MIMIEYGIWIDWSGKEILQTSLLMVCSVIWLAQMIYIWGIFSRFGFLKPTKRERMPKPVSIIIAAKNEYQNLFVNLPKIFEQDYPDFEVVVVDDASDDETGEYLKNLAREHKNLNIVTISSNKNFFKGKKFPLALGIKSAKHEYLLLTDADCRPSSKDWITEMFSCFDDKTQFVLGYGAYEVRKGLLNKLIRYDTVTIAMQYFSYAIAGNPYMGVGRNLAYRKSFFIAHKGFSSHYHISGGDDDLYINKHAHKDNTRICVSPESRTISFPQQRFTEYLRQKRRHLTTGFFYRTKHKYLLGLWSLTQILFFGFCVYLLVITFNVIPVLALLILREFSLMVVIKKSMIRLQEKNLLLLSPIFEIFLIVFNLLLVLTNLVKRDNKWR